MLCPKCDKVKHPEEMICTDCASAMIGANTIKDHVDGEVLKDVVFKAGYLKALKEFSYFKGGCEYVGHDRPRKLSDVLLEIESGKKKIEP